MELWTFTLTSAVDTGQWTCYDTGYHSTVIDPEYLHLENGGLKRPELM